MGLWQRIFGQAEPEQRSASAPTTWDLLRMNVGPDAGIPPSPYAAELHSAVTAAVATISEAVASLPLNVYRVDTAGDREETPGHPVARLFAGWANPWQSGFEFIELLQSWALLWGAGYAEIVRDGRAAVSALVPIHPTTSSPSDWRPDGFGSGSPIPTAGRRASSCRRRCSSSATGSMQPTASSWAAVASAGLARR